MTPAAITMTVLTHPLQALLIGMILSRLVREVVIASAGSRNASCPGSGRDRQPLATTSSDLRAA